MIELYPYQRKAVDRLHNGSVLCGKVGSGKSLTGLFYYMENHIDKPLYIITVAKKRNDREWHRDFEALGIDGVVDSWNNIEKYTDVKDAFFIFDEQRAIGYGKWGMAFIHIARKNNWIMLTATPGDVWMDWMCIFIANNFYRNKTDFVDQHVEYNPYSKFPQIRRYHKTDKLERFRRYLAVPMQDFRTTKLHRKYINADFDKDLYKSVIKSRFNPYTEEPIMNASEFTQVLRRIINTSERRRIHAKQEIMTRDRVIVFYNYTYELDILKEICQELDRAYYQWNGQKHEAIPDDEAWVYLVQYTAGAEGWNCITTDTILFYSLNYSYRIMEQSEGRINRVNTSFEDLYYIYLKSPASIDDAIERSIRSKKKFNERNWVENTCPNWNEISKNN
jgi:NAD-dependent DNA ligase (contains BRCT domain type II)|uniref:Chromatin remodeling complex ATPase n=2 Tax=unclassified Caudoviricetes TaxID=2788787 RepID=A0A8S5LU07_9CAUD|nr:MAG TPA: Chromatin remodeling complex ATPase [Siphoviridae sp. ctKm44]DAE09873.1 MAG TPA: Chromatin remodeling complex ATPase [Siphoviridae sp. ctJdE31]